MAEKDKKPDYEKFSKELEHVSDLQDTINHHAKIANVNLVNDLLMVKDEKTGKKIVKYDLLKDKEKRKEVKDYLKNQFYDLLKSKQEIDLSKVDPIIQKQIANSVYGFDENEIDMLLDKHQERFTHEFETHIDKKTTKNYEHYGEQIINKYDFKKEHLKDVLENVSEPLKYVHGKIDYGKIDDSKAKEIISIIYNKKANNAGKIQYFDKMLETYSK